MVQIQNNVILIDLPPTLESERIWQENNITTHCIPTYGTVRKSRITLAVTWHHWRRQSKIKQRHVRIQKVLTEGVHLWQRFFFLSLWGEGGPKCEYKLDFIGPPAKRHKMAFRWPADDGLTLNFGLVALWFFRGSGPVLLRNSIFCNSSGSGLGPPVSSLPPLGPRMRAGFPNYFHYFSLMCWTYSTCISNSPSSVSPRINSSKNKHCRRQEAL